MHSPDLLLPCRACVSAAPAPHSYKQLLFYATKLAPMPDEDHIPANKVEGCVSQVRQLPCVFVQYRHWGRCGCPGIFLRAPWNMLAVPRCV
mgnify:CR=1 FL=1